MQARRTTRAEQKAGNHFGLAKTACAYQAVLKANCGHCGAHAPAGLGTAGMDGLCAYLDPCPMGFQHETTVIYLRCMHLRAVTTSRSSFLTYSGQPCDSDLSCKTPSRICLVLAVGQ